MGEATLKVYEGAGELTAEHAVHGRVDAAALARLYQSVLHKSKCRYAVLREGRRVHALYLANDLVPAGAVRFSTRRGLKGEWATAAFRLGDWERVLLGPTLFFRQLDLRPQEAWLAPVLLGFPTIDAGKPRVFPDGPTLHEVEHDGSRFYYQCRGSRWKLYGAGNTPRERIEQVVAAEAPASASDFLWAIGAIQLL